MARLYHYYGQFEVHTDCSDVDKVAKAMNETARQFQDIMKYNKDGEGIMFISNDFEMDIPVNNRVETDEEEADVESA